MATTSVQMEPLYKRIRKTLQRSKQPDPSKIVSRLRPTLTDEEEEELIFEGLEDRIYNEMHVQRARATRANGERTLEERRARIDAERDEHRRQREARNIAEADARIATQTAERAAFREKMRDPIFRVQWEVAQQMADESRRIYQLLDRIDSSDRVRVAGEWKMLVDCEAEHLEALADEYVERAVDQNMRGAYYLALAKALRAGGFKTVGEMCEAQI